MAHKMGSGSTKNNRDSNSKRLGIKCTGNQLVKPGMILVRQRGTRYQAGNFVGCGRDFTLYSLIKGRILFKNRVISIVPIK